eukprot:jgi/Ulvmu1/4710/UM002_0441.1
MLGVPRSGSPCTGQDVRQRSMLQLSQWDRPILFASVRASGQTPIKMMRALHLCFGACNTTNGQGHTRRGIFVSMTTGAALCRAPDADASLVRFPAQDLNNTYLLVRAGECEADAAGIGYSNPVNKQSRYAELTTLGKQQVVKRLTPLLAPMSENTSAWLWAATNSASYQTAEILTSTLGLGRSRLVPEYSFLDSRGLGALDNRAIAEVLPVLKEGDASSSLWKPPRGYDGTPNESVQDVLVRARQALSVMETQYDDELVVIIAPDSTVLSVLQAALLGIDLCDHWELAFRPAEMRVVDLSTAAARDDSPVQLQCARPPLCL